MKIIEKIPFEKIDFPKIIGDFLAEKESVKPFYNLFSAPENFEKQIALKKNNPTFNRKLLQEIFQKQYEKIPLKKAVKKNIALLSQENTWTITTGHQLNLCTGPLYFIYKIITTINLTLKLQKRFPSENFIPVYWMASEDHDFQEINHFYFKGKKITWDQKNKGAVGKINPQNMQDFFWNCKQFFNQSQQSIFLLNVFEKAYLKTENLSEATRILVHALFEKYGLLILDADEKALKKHFIPVFEKELKMQIVQKNVQKTNVLLKKKYHLQAHFRSINLFYLKENLRERIILDEKKNYKIKDTSLVFSLSEILKELKKYPERFSPNVLLRPVYQEFILPNLAYVGGAGELSYWLQLKNLFDDLKIIFPILHLRNSALLVSQKQHQKNQKLGMHFEALFLSEALLMKNYLKKNTQKIHFQKEKKQIQMLFKNIFPKIKKIDFSLHATFAAAEKKQLNHWDFLEKKLYKAQKNKHKNEIQRLLELKRNLFPYQKLQERTENFSRFYEEIGHDFISDLMAQMAPWDFHFYVLKY